MVSKKEKWQNPDMALERKNIGLREAKDILEQAGQKLCSIIGNTSALHGSMQLDITTGSMSGTTAAVISGVHCIFTCEVYA